MAATPTCVWRATAAVVVALDDRFGPPLDAYVNGSQVWLLENGPGGVTVEWRLHPVAGFARPAGAASDELFESIALALSRGEEPAAPLEQLWDGLEAFPAYGDEIEPAPLAAAATAALSLPPDAAGLVDHRVVGDRWERQSGSISIVEALLEQLGSTPAP